MSLFKDETAMQKWICEELGKADGLVELISNQTYLDEFSPESIEQKSIHKSFQACMSAFSKTEIISEDENISLDRPDSLKPDLVMYSPETEGMVIVELKNLSGPSRQAGTELAAYACELRSYLPFLSDGDLFNVIISPVWSTLLRHYVFNEIFWQQKNLICLEPVQTNDGIKLKIVEIESLLEVSLSSKFSNQQITGFQLCLYDHESYTKSPERKRLDNHVVQMKAALSVMSVEGNRQNGHGFALLWKYDWEGCPAPYCISILNIAPFQSIERFLHDFDDMTDMQNRFIRLVQEEDPTGHGYSLQNIKNSGQRFLSGFCSPQPEFFSTWSALQSNMLNQSELLAFQGWGFFGDAFNEKLISEYASGNIDLSLTEPKLGLEVVNGLIDSDYHFCNLSDFGMDGDEDCY